ncbi:DNA polymerase III subunit alpha [Serratia symbiotica]|nr:DNA polymerase III subunit alpha [Serratia symbiotica]
MIKPKFIHLHIHSDYSIIDGIIKIEDLIKRASFLSMPALAITDFTNLFGIIKFYENAYNNGIKPIIGADFHVKSNILISEITQLTILAMNYVGYKNLILLISRAYKRGYNILGPIIDRDWLIDYHEGLILLSGARNGDVGKCLLRDNFKKVKLCLNFYQKYFPDCYYLELVRTGRQDEENYLHYAVKLANDYSLPVVATNDVRFLSKDDFDAHEIRVAIHNGITLNDPKRSYKYSSQQYLCTENDMYKRFIDIPEALVNSVEIAKRCNVNIRPKNHFLPIFNTGGMTTQDFLILKSKNGLKKRLKFLFPDLKIYNNIYSTYKKRLNTELNVINQMGFSSYFLIVMEFIIWSKNNNIPVGPGRGSGAGSLVAYSLNITDLDPLKFDLLFERFLNPERISMPDFDIDFCMEKRDLVIDHVSNTYGRESVSQIITFGTMAAKVVIRDVGRVLGYPYSFVDRIAKLIPLDLGITLKKAFLFVPQLSTIYKSDEEVRVLIDMACKLEGIIRNVGKHSGGIVISPTKITDFSPLYYDSKGNNPVTQFDKDDIEYAGLIKFDFLGLRTLTIINWAVNMINKRRLKNNKLPININSISLDDKKSFNMLQKSETTAVFQLESRGMKDLIKRLKPDCFEDMIALVALFRPGPLQSGMVDNFINRKHGREKISYPDIKWQHILLKPILKSTYGVILYQEQVMKIAQIFAGYTLGEADILRRAMGKKNPIEMAKQRKIFENGAKLNGINNKLAIKIFDLVEKFAGYGFNKSHSAAYALVSYQTLWLKTYAPAEFMAAVMSADMDNTDKILRLINECWRMKLKILSPNINSSKYYFHVNKNGEIVYGLGAIKGIGKGLITSIINVRHNHKKGYFKNLFDFCLHLDIKKVNRRILEKLILSGALDPLGPHRSALMNSLDYVLKLTNQHLENKNAGQIDMFDDILNTSHQIKKIYNNTLCWQEQTILDGERETLGLYLTGHPITQYLEEIKHYISYKSLKDIYPSKYKKIVTVVGLVIYTKILVTKTGKTIGICILNDMSGQLEIILLNSIFKKYQHLLEKDRILIINGYIKFNKFHDEFKMIANELMDISTAREKYVKRLAIFITYQQINDDFMKKLSQLLQPYRSGVIPVYLYFIQKYTNTKLRFNLTWNIILVNKLLIDLRNLVGHHQVELEF